MEPYRKKSDGFHVSHLFLDNNKPQVPGCTKMISSWERKVLHNAKVQVSPGTLLGAAAFASMVAGVSLVSIWQVGDWTRVSIPARHHISTYITTIGWHKDSVQ